MGQHDFTGWDTISVGPNLVGRVGPSRDDRKDDTFSADVTLVMGSQQLHLDINSFQWGYASFHPDYHTMGYVEDVLEMLRYNKRFVVPVPSCSLDISPAGKIEYSAKSVDTVMSALHKFFIALACDVQARLHSLSAVEVVRKFAELTACNYPAKFGRGLTWRGMQLNELLQNTSMKVVSLDMDYVLDSSYSNYLYAGDWDVNNLPRSSSVFGSLLSTPFGSFVDWQTRSRYDYTCEAPENVIHIRVHSEEEYRAGSLMFAKPKPIYKYMQAMMPEAVDASFFLSLAGDPLEDWIDGKTITLADIQAAAITKK